MPCGSVKLTYKLFYSLGPEEGPHSPCSPSCILSFILHPRASLQSGHLKAGMFAIANTQTNNFHRSLSWQLPSGGDPPLFMELSWSRSPDQDTRNQSPTVSSGCVLKDLKSPTSSPHPLSSHSGEQQGELGSNLQQRQKQAAGVAQGLKACPVCAVFAVCWVLGSILGTTEYTRERPEMQRSTAGVQVKP